MLSLLAQRRDRIEKQRERQLARTDVHRAELVQAHAAFIGAYTKALHVEMVVAACLEASRRGPLTKEAEQLQAKADEDHRAAQLEAEVRLAVLLLIEDSVGVVERLLPLRMLSLSGPTDADHLDEWHEEHLRRRKALSDFIMATTSSFSLKSWDTGRRVARATNETPNAPSHPVAQPGLGDSEHKQ